MLFSKRIIYAGIRVGRHISSLLVICLVLLLILPTFGFIGVHQAKAWVTIAQDNPSANPSVGGYSTGIGGGSYSFSPSCNDTWGTMWGNVINNGVDIWFNPYFNIAGNSDTITGSLTVTAIGHYTDGSQVSTSYTYNLYNASLPSLPSGSYAPCPNDYLGQQFLSLPATNNSAYLGYWQLEASGSFSGYLTASSGPYYNYAASISCYLNMWASYSEGNDAADEQTAQGAESAAQAAQSAAQGAQSAANTAATDAQSAQSAAQSAQSAAQAAQNNTWYNNNSAGYWAYQAYQKVQAAAAGPLSIQVTGQGGADATSFSSMGLCVAVTGGAGPYQYSVNGGGFSPLPSTGCIYVPVIQGSNQEKVTVKDANGETASAVVVIWGLQ